MQVTKLNIDFKPEIDEIISKVVMGRNATLDKSKEEDPVEYWKVAFFSFGNFFIHCVVVQRVLQWGFATSQLGTGTTNKRH